MKKRTKTDVIEKLKRINIVLISNYFGWDQKSKVKCKNCNTIFYSIINVLEQYGCRQPKCASKRRRLKAIKKFGSLADHPSLVKEYKSTNLIPPKELPCNYSTSVFWKCLKCKHEWTTPIRRRISPKNKDKKYTDCPGKCRMEASISSNINKSLKDFGPFSDNFPELMKEYDYKKNNYNLKQITKFSHKKAFWKCKLGHTWATTFALRAIGTDCPTCSNFQGSKTEVRIYTELKKIFEKVIWLDKFKNKQLDIHLPDYKFVIEVDGHFHLGQEKKDKKKNKFLEKNGLKVLRLRDFKLKTKISRDDFEVKTSDLTIEDIKKTLKILLKVRKIRNDEKKLIIKYFKNKNFINESDYRKIVSKLPGVPFEKSLEFLNPKISGEWHTELNGPLKPSMFSLGSKVKVYWKCPIGHKPYQHMITTRTRADRPANCPQCAREKKVKDAINKSIKKFGSLLSVAPNIAKQFNISKNGISPDKVSAHEVGKKRWWICKKHKHEWTCWVRDRVVDNYGKCKFC